MAENKTTAKVPAAQPKTEVPEVAAYTPKENEKHLFHVELDKPGFNPSTGDKITQPFIQMFTPAEYNQFAKNSAGLGYKQTIVWNPDESLD